MWLPTLASDRLERQAGAGPPDGPAPLAFIAPVKGALRITAVNDAARAQRIAPGMGLAQARAMLPGLVVRPQDSTGDAALLGRIADWAHRYTPLVGISAGEMGSAGVGPQGGPEPDGLMLDITGAAHLFGGEGALVADMEARLGRQGFQAVMAVAGTPGAAFALSRFGRDGAVIASGTEREHLAPLPVAALRLPADMVASLERLGLKHIGDILERPRAPLTARFGALLLHRLDQALGREGEAITPRQPVPAAEVEMRLMESIVRESDVSLTAAHLAGDLCRMLDARGEGARQIVLSVFRVDGVVKRIETGTATPCRDAKMLHGLLALRLKHLEDPLDAGYGFDLVRLAATAVGRLDAEARNLTGLGQNEECDIDRVRDRLADRLAARFGRTCVRVALAADHHSPEQASRLVPIGAAAQIRAQTGAKTEPQIAWDDGPLWPLRLFEPPEPIEIIAMVPDGPPLRLRWRRQSLRITAAEGPERIGAPWWQQLGRPMAPARDYYRVTDESGRRLWIFREGLYGAPDRGSDGAAPPRWFVHGLFA